MFSGLLYCADCGSKMTFHRQMAQSAEKHNFVCELPAQFKIMYYALYS
ncbi:recombinase zinc beta ribbon domain-containing protein [Clostridioides difficile]|nr:recombinase zinc beta ribbon domain-containing protein [Clostridioides difficile]